jgi:hypothetical protein
MLMVYTLYFYQGVSKFYFTNYIGKNDDFMATFR